MSSKHLSEFKSILEYSRMGLIALLLLIGCTNPEHKALQPYAHETLTAGVGLGNIKLGQTTLGWIVETFGQGQISVLYSDDTWIELGFKKGEIRFNFFVSGQCQQDTNSPGTRLNVEQGIQKFLKQYPSCEALPLTRLYLTARNTKPNQTFYKGSTEQGIKLWDRFADVDVSPNPGISIEMTQASQKITYIETLESISIRPGLNVYYQGATDYEIRSGKPLSEERLKELENAKNISLQEGVVRQLSIYLP